jgi:hypothetical protein
MIDYTKDPIYKQKTEVKAMNLSPYHAICIKGSGDPNQPLFSEKLASLYKVAYLLKTAPRKGIVIPAYEEYKVYPLEGLWDISLEAKQKNNFQKSDFVYTLMIRQPDFITKAIFDKVISFHHKNLSLNISEVYFDEIDEGNIVQILHIGSYDDEPRSFDVLKAYINEHHLSRRTLVHKEIYLSDARKTEPSKLKTILRYFIF